MATCHDCQASSDGAQNYKRILRLRLSSRYKECVLSLPIFNQTLKFLRFLLARLYLDSLIGKRSPKAIRTALAILPTGSEAKAYDYAYQNAMERIEGQLADQEQLAKQALSWITCAKRPLTTSELQHALGVEIGLSTLDEDNLPQIEDIVSICAGLVTVDEESKVIRLVHYTTQEYFQRTQKDWFPNAETEITAVCISYLSFKVFESGFCPTDEEFERRLWSNPLYDYASHNWGRHACHAVTLDKELVEFLRFDAKVEASSQAMISFKRWPEHSNYSQKAPQKMTGLHLMAYFGVQWLAEILIRDVADADVKNSHGRTPLSYATEGGYGGRRTAAAREGRRPQGEG